jgi:hypothetical protein
MISSYTEFLCEQLQQIGLSPQEVAYRKKRLKQAEASVNSRGMSYDSLAHEIKAFLFLSRFGTLHVANDYRNEPGCDCILNQRYQIECVCSTAGNTKRNGLDKYSFQNTLGHIIDYGEKERILFSRLTSSLSGKLKLYQRHVNDEKKTISSTDPYIIYLGLGSLSHEMLLNPDNNAIEFTGILLVKGNPVVAIHIPTQQSIVIGYTCRRKIKKWNHESEIDSAVFCLPDYTCVSGVFISSADLYEEYTDKNTWLFTNPYATHKIAPKDFPGITYWASDENGMYRAYQDN